VIPCDPQWARICFSLVLVFFLPLSLALKKEKKRFISVFLFEAISKKKKKFSFQFGKVVRVGYLLKRKKSLFFKFFIDFLKHK
jgi:hypothetical protein